MPNTVNTSCLQPNSLLAIATPFHICFFVYLALSFFCCLLILLLEQLLFVATPDVSVISLCCLLLLLLLLQVTRGP